MVNFAEDKLPHRSVGNTHCAFSGQSAMNICKLNETITAASFTFRMSALGQKRT
jgi:hypothetical protein